MKDDRIPSGYPHPLYEVRVFTDSYRGDYDDRVCLGHTHEAGARIEDADVVSSQIYGTRSHTVMLDLDVPAYLVPSSTPGHTHLYIDVAIPWRQYKRLLRLLAKVGVIEKGYYRASVARKGTHLRLPGVSKATAPDRARR